MALAPYISPNQGEDEIDPIEAAAYAIASVESRGSGDYSALGPVMTEGSYKGDRAYGKYQVMGRNIPSWTEQHLGQRMTPNEFLNSPPAQEAVFRGEIEKSYNKYGNLDDAASVWFTGQPYSVGRSRNDTFISGEQYVSKFRRGLDEYARERGASASEIEQYLLRTEQPLAYSDDQRRRMNQQEEAMQQGDRPRLTYGPEIEAQQAAMGDPLTMAIRAAANPAPATMSTAPQPPMMGPRSGIVPGQAPQAPEIPRVDTLGTQSPERPTAPSAPQLPDMTEVIKSVDPSKVDETVDQVVPAPKGQRPTSEIINEGFQFTGNAADYGLAESEKPQSVSEAVEAVQAPPASDDTSAEEKEKREKRRMMAADMLEVLSVGLGQMAVGGAVNVGGVLQNQAARREAQIEREQEAAAQAQAKQEFMAQATQVAQALQSRGMTQMARIAMSGPEGLETAMQAYQTISTRAPKPGDFLSNLTTEQRVEYLSGFTDPDTAARVGVDPYASKKFFDSVVIPEMAAQGERERVRGQAMTLAQSAIPLSKGNPKIATALQPVLADPTDAEAVQTLRDTMIDEGADMPSTPLTQAEADIYGDALGLSPRERQQAQADPQYAATIREAGAAELEKRGERSGTLAADQAANARESAAMVNAGVLTPAEAEVASINPDRAYELSVAREAKEKETADNAQAQSQALAYANMFPQGEEIFDGVETKEDLKLAVDTALEQYGPTADMKNFILATKDPDFRAYLTKKYLSEAGVQMTATQEALLESELAINESMSAKYGERLLLTNAMEQVMRLGDDPNYEGGGPITGPILTKLQAAANDVFGIQAEGLFVNPNTEFGNRLVEAYLGEFFQTIRPEGSGQVSDKESALFAAAFPDTVDSKTKQVALAQKILYAQQLAETTLRARQEWLLKHDEDPDKQLDGAAMDAYINEQVGKKMRDQVYPTVSATVGDNGEIQLNLPKGISTNSVVQINGEFTILGDWYERTTGERLQDG